jgi:DNA helicase HerA-like ATPase
LASGHPIDLPRLLEMRMLIQAGSGFGKSWALRRLLEQTAPMVQQLVLDPEGEFASLRERFDYVICAPHDADAIATPRTAALLARRLLETGVSAILDIYDLKAHDRETSSREPFSFRKEFDMHLNTERSARRDVAKRKETAAAKNGHRI